MENLKSNIQDITKDGENIVNSYVKLFGIRQSQKLAIFLGVLASVFIISTLILIVVVFGSLVLANYLSVVLESEYLGFVIIAGLYLLLIGVLLFVMNKTGKPLLSNLFVRFIIPLLGVEISQKPTFDGLEIEKELVKGKIENDKGLLDVHAQLLKYAVFEDFFAMIIGLFKSKKKDDSEEESPKEE